MAKRRRNFTLVGQSGEPVTVLPDAGLRMNTAFNSVSPSIGMPGTSGYRVMNAAETQAYGALTSWMEQLRTWDSATNPVGQYDELRYMNSFHYARSGDGYEIYRKGDLFAIPVFNVYIRTLDPYLLYWLDEYLQTARSTMANQWTDGTNFGYRRWIDGYDDPVGDDKNADVISGLQASRLQLRMVEVYRANSDLLTRSAGSFAATTFARPSAETDPALTSNGWTGGGTVGHYGSRNYNPDYHPEAPLTAKTETTYADRAEFYIWFVQNNAVGKHRARVAAPYPQANVPFFDKQGSHSFLARIMLIYQLGKIDTRGNGQVFKDQAIAYINSALAQDYFIESVTGAVLYPRGFLAATSPTAQGFSEPTTYSGKADLSHLDMYQEGLLPLSFMEARAKGMFDFEIYSNTLLAADVNGDANRTVTPYLGGASRTFYSHSAARPYNGVSEVGSTSSDATKTWSQGNGQDVYGFQSSPLYRNFDSRLEAFYEAGKDRTNAKTAMYLAGRVLSKIGYSVAP